MNKNYLSWICRVGLLGLMAGSITLAAKSAEAKTSTLKSPENLEANVIDNSVIAATQNDAPSPKSNINEVSQNLNANSLELVKVNAQLTAVEQIQPISAAKNIVLPVENNSAKNTTVISS